MTVERRGWLHSSLSPKILDEKQSPRTQPARTFFIEAGELVPEAKEEGPIIPVSPAVAVEVAKAAPMSLVDFALLWGQSGFRDPSPVEAVKVADRSVELIESSYLPAERAGIHTRTFSVVVTTAPYPQPRLWRFHTFWHPQAVGFRRVLESRGLARLVRWENQTLSSGTDLPDQQGRFDYFRSYGPQRYVDKRCPRDEVDFAMTGPFSEDNWELFFDCLLHGAQRLDEDGQHDAADEIWGLLLNRSRVAEPCAWNNPELYQTAPIRASLQTERKCLRGLIDDQDRLQEDILA